MKKLLLLFLFLCSLEVAQAQPGISTAIPSEKPSKYQKDQIKRKYGMFIHFGINTFHDVGMVRRIFSGGNLCPCGD